MKKKLTARFALMSAAAIAVLGLGCASTSQTTIEVVWDDSIATGVTRITNDGIPKDSVRVSPDGTKLLYAEATKKDASGNLAWNIVYLRSATNPAKTPLINDFAFAPSWYEDNTRFLYISFEGGTGKIVRSSTAGGGKTYITRTPLGDTDNNPAIKNGLIVCSAWMNGKWQLVSVKESGAEPTFIGDGRYPSWHPTQNKILFVRDGDIYEMDMSNNYQVTQMWSDPKYACYMPSYSPDGTKILFARGTLTKANAQVKEETTFKNFFTGLFSGKTKNQNILAEVERTHLFVIPADGSTNEMPISSGRASVSSPCWGKNNEIFCLVSVGKGQEIFKLQLRNF